MNKSELYDIILGKASDGQSLVLTKDDIAPGDGFLNLNGFPKVTVTFRMDTVPFRLEFDNDEPMRLDELPTRFLETLVRNL